jgi:rhodanese-related sulfurtransferase
MSGDSVRRDVVMIVLGGAVLGLLYNGVGLATRPPRGIPWITAQQELPKLDDLIGPDSTTMSAEPDPVPGTTAAPSTSPAPASTPSEPARAARGETRTPAPPVPPAAGREPATPGTGTPTSAALPEPRRVPLPFVPDSDQPIQVEIAMTKRFFDARGALFLDARDPAEYQKGHIPGAIRLTNPEAQNEPERVRALPVEGRPTIIYCEGGTCEASLDLARFLLESGFKKVMVYMGGYPEWEAAGHPVERGSGR